jgi:hypothetical protein
MGSKWMPLSHFHCSVANTLKDEECAQLFISSTLNLALFSSNSEQGNGSL